jgi:hypothetical protein
MNFEFLDFLMDSIHFYFQLFMNKDFVFYCLLRNFLKMFKIRHRISLHSLLFNLLTIAMSSCVLLKFNQTLLRLILNSQIDILGLCVR